MFFLQVCVSVCPCMLACTCVLWACASLCARSAISVFKVTAVGCVFCTFVSGAHAKSDFGFQIHRCGRCFLRVRARSEITPRNLRCCFASLCFQCVRACSHAPVCFGFACASLCARSAISVGKGFSDNGFSDKTCLAKFGHGKLEKCSK